MRWWWPLSGDPGDSVPPAPLPELEIEPPRPRLVSVKEVDQWISAAEEREFMVWKQIDLLLLELKPIWPLRTRAIRRELKWLRAEAKKRDYDWGRDVDP